jgi:hypothetical protein
MNNPFAAVEILFSNKSPDRLHPKDRSGKSIFSPLSRFSPTTQFQAKPHLVGNKTSLYPTYCGDKEKIEKSYKNVTRTIFPNELGRIPASPLRKPQLIRRCEQKNQRDFLPRDGGNFP